MKADSDFELAAAANAAEAEQAGLRYTGPEEPGITRVRRGKGFQYLDSEGAAVTDQRVIDRIRALVIPPAWSDVWICRQANGHLQAVGRDARGRKQYRYHADWRSHRDATKFERLCEFGYALPRIRRRIAKDLELRQLSRTRVLAAIAKLLDETGVRIGNDEYARENGSYGLTTLRNQHVMVNSEKIRLKFRGKSGKSHDVTLANRQVARIIRRCQDLPGQRLFQYEDDEGVLRAIGSTDVNAYLQGIAGAGYSAKDFRTWSGTVIAASVLRKLPPPESDTEAAREIVQAVDAVATELGNTRAVARSAYIHPAILDAFAAGTLHGIDPTNALRRIPSGLSGDERVTLAVLSAT
jgi:DNA topoisomerase I